MTETTKDLVLLVDAFELCARTNLESAANSLDRIADRSERIGAYFTTATEGK